MKECPICSGIYHDYRTHCPYCNAANVSTIQPYNMTTNLKIYRAHGAMVFKQETRTETGHKEQRFVVNDWFAIG